MFDLSGNGGYEGVQVSYPIDPHHRIEHENFIGTQRRDEGFSNNGIDHKVLPRSR